MAVATSVPPGERVLWRGGPEPSRAMRDWLLGDAVSLVVGGLWTVISIGFVAGMAGGSVLPWVLPFLIGVPLVAALLWLPFAALRVRRRAAATRYTLTERRLVTESPSGRTDLRLANLPDLRLVRKRDGSGAITFSPPAGAGPDRYLRRMSRLLMMREEPAELMSAVPAVQDVFDLMRSAQASSMGTASNAPGETSPDGPRMASGPRSPVVDEEGPVARLSFTESAASVPLWFGGAFLLAGLGVMALAVVGGLAGDGWPLLGLGGFFALIGGALVRGRLRSVRAQGRLRARGRRVTGRVVDVAATGVRANRQEQWVVRYAYEAVGRSHSGHSPPMPWARAAGYAAGDEITLLVDADDPSWSVIAGLEV
ncbi:MAG: hypothetical protein A2V85_03535 [Chloroflexi bacterium RBG_16_72_14]|nr:MAG: hypothetical protein A2V85_03535 [Chloroflexi bacterium RBG_16_72_14]